MSTNLPNIPPLIFAIGISRMSCVNSLRSMELGRGSVQREPIWTVGGGDDAVSNTRLCMSHLPKLL